METITERVTMTDETEAQVKHHFSKQHLVSAAHFAARSSEIESDPEIYESQRQKHRAYVTGAVVFSVAFLEASINELYLQAIDKSRKALQGLTDQQLATLAEKRAKVDRKSLFVKYQTALEACGCDRFDSTADLFQGTAALVEIRNALIHYRPEFDDELKVHKDLKDNTKGRFELNAHASPGTLWFPHQCLGAGCANWAVSQARKFMEEFTRILKIPKRFR